MGSLETLFGLRGAVVVITGGAGMLGQTYAEAIIEAGGKPVLLDINEAAVNDQIKRLGSQSFGLKCDITDSSQIRLAHDKILERFGHVDVLINNAANNPSLTGETGMQHSSRLETMSIEQWQQDLDVGLTGAFLCSQIFGHTMAVQRKGNIINISSDLGIISPDQRLYRRDGVSEEEQDVKPVTYSATKTGLLGLTRYLATYWAKENVRANAICFGGVYNGQAEKFLSVLSERIPLGRMANREEYKGPIIFLCSEASSYMTGATIIIDGGRTIW